MPQIVSKTFKLNKALARGTCSVSPIYLYVLAELSQTCACTEPPCSCREVRNHRDRMCHPLRQSHFLRIWLVSIGPIDKQRASNETFAWSESPESTVVAVVSVVAHHKEVVRRNEHRREVVAPVEVARVRMHHVGFV